jgi:hypothetical protein
MTLTAKKVAELKEPGRCCGGARRRRRPERHFFTITPMQSPASTWCVVSTATFERLFAFLVVGHGRRQLPNRDRLVLLGRNRA